MEKEKDLVCVLCGAPWLPGYKNRCECGGFCTWGKKKDGPPSSWDVQADGSWTPKPVPKEHFGRQLSRFTKWRIRLVWIVIFSLMIWQPFWFFIGYCGLAYTVVTWMILTGQLQLAACSLRKRIASHALTILFAPLFFLLVLLYAMFAIM